MEGPVAAEEGGAGDEPAEGYASGGNASEVGRGGDPEEDLLQEIVGEGGCLRRWCHFLFLRRGQKETATKTESASSSRPAIASRHEKNMDGRMSVDGSDRQWRSSNFAKTPSSFLEIFERPTPRHARGQLLRHLIEKI